MPSSVVKKENNKINGHESHRPTTHVFIGQIFEQSDHHIHTTMNIEDFFVPRTAIKSQETTVALCYAEQKKTQGQLQSKAFEHCPPPIAEMSLDNAPCAEISVRKLIMWGV